MSIKYALHMFNVFVVFKTNLIGSIKPNQDQYGENVLGKRLLIVLNSVIFGWHWVKSFD